MPLCYTPCTYSGAAGTAVEAQAMHHPAIARPKSLIPAHLLQLLSQRARHGYELAETLRLLGFEGVTTSLVYRELARLEEEGLVQSFWQASQGRGPGQSRGSSPSSRRPTATDRSPPPTAIGQRRDAGSGNPAPTSSDQRRPELISGDVRRRPQSRSVHRPLLPAGLQTAIITLSPG